MDGLFDIITSMGYRFLINQSSVNNGDIMNIIANDNSVNLSTYFVEILFNKSLFIPINNNGSYQLNNLTSTSNPYLITTAFSIFWVLMFLIFFILLIGVSIYQCVKENQLKSCNKIGVIPSEKPNRNRRKFMKTNWKTILIGLMTVSFFLWIIFLVLLSIEQYVVGSKLSQNLSKSTNANQYNSLTNVIELSLKYFYNMYSIITVDSLNFFNSSASMMSSSVSNQIQSSIKQFIDQILTDFHVNSLFNHVSALINGLNLLLNAMDVISSKRDILNVINQIKGQISVYQSNIASDLQSLCPKLARTSNLYSTCFSFQTTTKQFQTTIDTSQINTDSSIIMLFLIRMLQINMTSVTTTYQQVYTNFNNSLTSIVGTSTSTIDVSKYFSAITSIWSTTVIPLVTQFFNSTSTVNATTADIMNKFYIAENVTIILLIIFICLLTVLIIISFYRQSINHKKWTKCANFSIQIGILFFTVLAAIVSLALVLGTSYINVAVCQQFNSTNGITLSDQMINKKLSAVWPNIVANLLNSPNAIQITLNQPTNIISGISSQCRNTSIGLLNILGMSNLVNVTQIIQSTGISTILISSQKTSYNAFMSNRPSEIIPPNMVNTLNQLRSNISILDSYDYSSSIQQLSIPLLGVPDFISYIQNLSTFVQSAIKLIGMTAELSSLNRTSSNLVLNLPNYNDTQNSMNVMLTKYQVLQSNRNNSLYVNLVIDDIHKVTVNLANDTNVAVVFFAYYNQTIITNMMASIIQIISSSLTSLTNQILPCSNLSTIYEALTTSICTTNNMKDALAALGLLLIMVTVMSQIISLLMVIFTLLTSKYLQNSSKC